MLREQKIDERINQIASMTADELKDEISAKYDMHKHKYNALVRWDSLKLTQRRLGQICAALGAHAVSRIVMNYCKDFKYWNHGMPDLVLWSAEKQQAKFSEVKSESDRLSEV